jgi:hypothetical protein
MSIGTTRMMRISMMKRQETSKTMRMTMRMVLK